jgi:hypothetical protein
MGRVTSEMSGLSVGQSAFTEAPFSYSSLSDHPHEVLKTKSRLPSYSHKLQTVLLNMALGGCCP